MRTLACLMILAGAVLAACQSKVVSNSPYVHADTQPHPLNTVTNPLNQPNIDSHGMPR